VPRRVSICFLFLIAVGCLTCSCREEPAPPVSTVVTAYWYKWPAEEQPGWERYVVRDPQGREIVGDWVAKHRVELERAAQLGDIIPKDIFTVSFDDGHGQWYPLLLRVPRDPTLPKGLRTSMDNFNPEDIEELRRIFKTHGERAPSGE
jgi:hypothetical protein